MNLPAAFNAAFKTRQQVPLTKPQQRTKSISQPADFDGRLVFRIAPAAFCDDRPKLAVLYRPGRLHELTEQLELQADHPVTLAAVFETDFRGRPTTSRTRSGFGNFERVSNKCCVASLPCRFS